MSAELRRAKEIFELAVEVDADSRDKLISKACGEDLALLERVQALLREHDKSGDLLDTNPGQARSRKASSIPEQIAHYRILEKLGSGGMGEVWKAEDTQLRRTVALKFLSSDSLENEEVKARLIREAQAAASLDHPNICAVYGIHEEQGETFIAMAYVDGPSLADKIAERPLPINEALNIAIQISEGLQEAHEKGIVHRDVKPTNVILTAKARVKIMDFGLAAVTGRSRLTKAGTTLGTPAYMAPEQLEGREVDRRADIWSLGVVLYEMVSGRLPFESGNEHGVLYGIVNSDPEPLSAQRVGLPLELDRIVAKAMSKNAAERYQNVADMLVDLRRLRSQEPRTSSAVVQPPVRSLLTEPLVVGLVAFCVLAAALTAWLTRQPADAWEDPLEGARFTRLTDFAGVERDADISADGKYVAFLSDRDGPVDAWVGRIDGGEFVNLTNGRFPELSGPWVRSVGFSGDGGHVWLRVAERDPETNRILAPRTWLTPALGGRPARPFLESSTSVAWSPDGERIAYQERAPGDPIVVADRNGGNPTRLFAREPGGHCHFPVWSPDGRFIYFVSGLSGEEWDVWRVATAGGQAERITSHNSGVRYPTLIDNRTLLYIATTENGAGSVLYAMDVEQRLPHRVSSGLEQYTSLAADAGGSGASRRLVATLSDPVESLWSVPISADIVDEEQARRLRPPNARGTGPRLGPDFLLYLSSTGTADGLWKFSDNTAVELWKVEDGGLTFPPALSPDGRQICFSYRKQDKAALYVMSADGTSVRLLTEAFQVRTPPSWSPDGSWIVVGGDEGNDRRIFKVRVDDGTSVRLVENLSHYPVWSPDGSFILYTDGTQGGPTRSVKAITPDGRPFELPALSVLRGGERYHFLPDGSGLVVLRGWLGDQNFWLFDLETGNLRQLTDLRGGEAINSFDVSPDGKQIVFDRVREESDIVLIELAGGE